MAETIRQSDLRNDNAAIMRRVAAGESFVVTVNGRPVADLAPHKRESVRRRFVPAAELAEDMASLPTLDLAAWARDVESADSVLGPDAPEDPFLQRRSAGDR